MPAAAIEIDQKLCTLKSQRLFIDLNFTIINKQQLPQIWARWPVRKYISNRSSKIYQSQLYIVYYKCVSHLSRWKNINWLARCRPTVKTHAHCLVRKLWNCFRFSCKRKLRFSARFHLTILFNYNFYWRLYAHFRLIASRKCVKINVCSFVNHCSGGELLADLDLQLIVVHWLAPQGTLEY